MIDPDSVEEAIEDEGGNGRSSWLVSSLLYNYIFDLKALRCIEGLSLISE